MTRTDGSRIPRNGPRRCAGAAAAVAAGVLARPAWAAGGGGGSIGDLVWPAINLALLLAVIIYFARKPIQSFFTDRAMRVRDDLEAASRSLAAAEARHAEWQRKVANLDAELAQIRRTAAERAEAERRRILEDAARSAERLRADARAAVDQELRRARQRLRDEAAALAVELAANALQSEVGEADQSRLLDEFIATVERGATAPGADAS